VTAAGAPTVQVEALAPGAEWDEFVSSARAATFFHRSAWLEAAQGCFGFAAHFLAARRAGRLVGVLPLGEMRPPFGRPRLLSLPLAVEAGVCADDADARRALESAALALARALGAHEVELRDAAGPPAGVYCRFRRALAASDEDDLASIPRKRRRMIRRARDSGLEARRDAGLEVFYDLYARGQQRLGTPLLPADWFETLLRRFPADSVLLTVFRRARPLAGVLAFEFRGTVLPYYAGSSDEALRCGANDFLYWELMRLARRRGLGVFDFGRSRRGSGAFDYKRHWGCEPEPLRYRRLVLDGEPTPRASLDDPGLRLLRWGWRHVPLALGKRLGPPISRRAAAWFT